MKIDFEKCRNDYVSVYYFKYGPWLVDISVAFDGSDILTHIDVIGYHVNVSGIYYDKSVKYDYPEILPKGLKARINYKCIRIEEYFRKWYTKSV